MASKPQGSYPLATSLSPSARILLIDGGATKEIEPQPLATALAALATPAVAPTNASVPVITGTAQVGQTLNGSQGTWNNSPTSYSYQWKSDGVNVGISQATYSPVAGDIGHTITLRVTATNSAGSATAVSAATAAVIDVTVGAPANTALPTISGTVQVGQTLTGTQGSWTNSPTSFAYQWRSNGVAVGLNQTTYVPVSGDTGNTLTFSVTATNVTGSVTATSAATIAVAAAALQAPVNSTIPVITGTLQEGQVIAATTGNWSGNPTGYAYQWKSNNVNVGTNSNTYNVLIGDIGHRITVTVTAVNAVGSGQATSAQTAPIISLLWSPAYDNGLYAFYDSLDQTTITVAGGLASSWVPLFGVGTITQPVGTKQPGYVATQPVTFDGGDIVFADGFNMTGTTLALGGIMSIASDSAADARLMSVANTGGTAGDDNSPNRACLRRVASGPNVAITANGVSTTAVAITYDTYTIIQGFFTGTQAGIGVNGVAATGLVSVATDILSQRLSLGGMGAGGIDTGMLHGGMQCAWATKSIDVITRQKYEGYAAWRYGKQALLPAIHPWRNEAPTITSPPVGNAPANTTLPAISGTMESGSTLTVTNGVWNNNPTSYAYQWKRGSSTSPLNNALPNVGTNVNTYTLVNDDQGYPITCTITATNANGSTAAVTSATASIGPRSLAGWTPASDPGLIGFWDTVDNTKFTLASGFVTSWATKFGTAPALAQATTANKPSYTSGGPVVFDGINDIMFTDGLTISGAHLTMGAIVKPTDAAKSGRIVSMNVTGGTQIDWSNPALTSMTYLGDRFYGAAELGSPMFALERSIAISSQDGVNANQRVNGRLAGAAANTKLVTAQRILIAGANTSSSTFDIWPVEYTCVWLTTTTDVATLEKYEAYVATLYDMHDFLPRTHHYKVMNPLWTGTTPTIVDSPSVTIAPGVQFSSSSFVHRLLPDAAPLDPASAAMINYMVNTQVPNAYNVWSVNIYGGTPQIHIRGAGVPTSRVLVDGGETETGFDEGFAALLLQTQMNYVPMPPSAQTVGTDLEMLIYQQTKDTCWELWIGLPTGRATKDSTGALVKQWQTRWGGRMQSVSTNPGYFISDGSGYNYGTTATGLPFLAYTATVKEMLAGSIHHMVGIALPGTKAYTHVFPAQRNDGGDTNPNAIPEGAIMRLPRSLNIDAIPSIAPMAKMFAHACQDYGCVVWDFSGVVGFRAEDPTNNYIGTREAGTDPYLKVGGIFGRTAGQDPNSGAFWPDSNGAFYGFPLSQLQVLQLGWTGAGAPANVTVPVITGTLTVGSVLTSSTGTWSDTITSYAYQWKSSGTNVGSNSNTYTLVSGDSTHTMTCTVTATNANGSGTGTSAATAAVSGGGGGGAWLPSSDTGLVGYWDSLDPATLTVASTLVSAWVAKYGSGTLAAAGALRPTVASSGAPVVFNGANRLVSNGFSITGTTLTLGALVSITAAGSNPRIVSCTATNGPDDDYEAKYAFMSFYGATSGLTTYVDGSAVGPADVGFSTDGICEVVRGASGAAYVGVNTVFGNGIGDGNTAFTIQRIALGADATGATASGSPLTGIIKAVWVTRSIDATSRAQMEGYVAWRYGATALLPSYHPYKSTAP